MSHGAGAFLHRVTGTERVLGGGRASSASLYLVCPQLNHGEGERYAVLSGRPSQTGQGSVTPESLYRARKPSKQFFLLHQRMSGQLCWSPGQWQRSRNCPHISGNTWSPN